MTSGVVGFIDLCSTSEPIHPPLVLRGDLGLCWKPYAPLVLLRLGRWVDLQICWLDTIRIDYVSR